ncbi:FAD-binding protein [Actinocrinis sp.]|uniref:FAD-binding protein n=1 Tax=Actinocrinis sp. TaxID=1920516 RepID=UPI0032C228C0
MTRTLALARRTGTHVVPRGGGHCFAGRSSTTGLVLDLSHLDSVTIQPGGLTRSDPAAQCRPAVAPRSGSPASRSAAGWA